MNVLLTSVGRRSYLVNYFKQALKGAGKVVGANMFENAAGMVAADLRVVTPPANHPEYIPFIADICRQYEVGLLCSLHDLDVYMLSQDQRWLEETGIAHTLPSAEWGRICLDKYECNKNLEAAEIPVPKTTVSLIYAIEAIKNGEMHFPLIVKARAGFGSLGLARCENEAELIAAYEAAHEQALASGSMQYISLPDQELVLIQQCITGQEICVGIVNDLSGTYRSHFACEVHSMRSGESDWATSIARTPHEESARKFSQLTGHKGIWGVDFLDDGGVYRAIDVNPRFTGDYPFHHLAGANVPAALLAWCRGVDPELNSFAAKPGVTGFKELVPTVAFESSL